MPKDPHLSGNNGRLSLLGGRKGEGGRGGRGDLRDDRFQYGEPQKL